MQRAASFENQEDVHSGPQMPRAPSFEIQDDVHSVPEMFHPEEEADVDTNHGRIEAAVSAPKEMKLG